jgi:hypothetical protein
MAWNWHSHNIRVYKRPDTWVSIAIFFLTLALAAYCRNAYPENFSLPYIVRGGGVVLLAGYWAWQFMQMYLRSRK